MFRPVSENNPFPDFFPIQKKKIKAAAGLMIENNISYIPIIYPDQTVEGIVTWKDIMKYLVEHGAF